MMEEISKKKLCILFGIIVTINFLYAITYRIVPVVDAEAYHEIATNIARTGEYRANISTPLELDGSITRIGPGYEYFVAIHYLLFGQNLWVIHLTQAILYGLTIIMLAVLATRLFPEIKKRPKFIYTTIILFGLLIDMVQLNAMLMTESLFLFFLTLSFFIYSEILHNNRNIKSWWMLLGIVLGISTLIRPSGLLIFFLICTSMIFILKTKKMMPILLVTVLFIGVQMPWIIRNYEVFGKFIFHSTADGMNLLSGNYPGNHGEFNADFPLFKEMKTRYVSPVTFSTEAKGWYRNFVINHPAQALRVIVEKILIFPSLAKTSGFWFHYFGKNDQMLTILLSAAQNTIIIGAQIFFWLLILGKTLKKQVTKEELFIVGSAIALAATSILTVVANRHRLPLTVMSLPIVAYVFALTATEPRASVKKIAVVIAILAISTTIDVSFHFEKLKERVNSFTDSQLKTVTIIYA